MPQYRIKVLDAWTKVDACHAPHERVINILRARIDVVHGEVENYLGIDRNLTTIGKRDAVVVASVGWLDKRE